MYSASRTRSMFSTVTASGSGDEYGMRGSDDFTGTTSMREYGVPMRDRPGPPSPSVDIMFALRAACDTINIPGDRSLAYASFCATCPAGLCRRCFTCAAAYPLSGYESIAEYLTEADASPSFKSMTLF